MMNTTKDNLRLFLCGDVMPGRGIDQILPHPSHPQIDEPYIKDARDYVLLAEEANGKIDYPVTTHYIWGDALDIWKKMQPTLEIINLESAITTHDEYWPGKGIQYRMHPENIGVLKAAGIEVCTLGNNHILDWCDAGLIETVSTLKNAGIQCSGAGKNINEAMKPAIFDLQNGKRILIFSAGFSSSGVSPDWAATPTRPGVFYLPDFSQNTIDQIALLIQQHKKANDLVILSLHWGSNWGYEIAESYRAFAHALIDDANVDVIFGHSSHHPRPIEIYHGKTILYGCGDFLNDYEGISGYEEFRSDLSIMYFLDFDFENLKFQKMTLIPLKIKKFSLHRANQKDSEWLLDKINHHAFPPVKFQFQNQTYVYSLTRS